MECNRHTFKPGKEIVPNIGQPVLVTGASSGLGRELAIKFSRNPWTANGENRAGKGSNHVILSGRNQAALEETAKLCADPANTSIVCGDLRDGETLAQLVSTSAFYGIRFAIFSAGLYMRGPLRLADRHDVEEVLQTNIATINLVRRLYPVLVRPATIININSVAGKNIAVDEAVYSASKHALTGFFKSFRFEARKDNVRVMDVFPGGLDTPMCAARPDHEKFIQPAEAADIIHTLATHPKQSVMVEELTLGRVIF